MCVCACKFSDLTIVHLIVCTGVIFSYHFFGCFYNVHVKQFRSSYIEISDPRVSESQLVTLTDETETRSI